MVPGQVVYTREEGGEQQEVTAEEGETLELLAAGRGVNNVRPPGREFAGEASLGPWSAEGDAEGVGR